MKYLKLTLLILIFFTSFNVYAVSEMSSPVVTFKRVGTDLSVSWTNDYPKNTLINLSDNENIDSTVVNANGIYLKNVSPNSFALTIKITSGEQVVSSEIQIPELVEDKILPNIESNPFWLQELQKQYYTCQQQITALQKEKQNTIITPVTYVYPSLEPIAQMNNFQSSTPQVSSAVATKPVTDVKGIVQTQKIAKINAKTNSKLLYTLLIFLVAVIVLFFFSHKLRRIK